jgi:hypothetical protein
MSQMNLDFQTRTTHRKHGNWVREMAPNASGTEGRFYIRTGLAPERPRLRVPERVPEVSGCPLPTKKPEAPVSGVVVTDTLRLHKFASMEWWSEFDF